MTSTEDLVTWLSGVLDEDEREAVAAVRWSEGCGDWVHIARHDPAAILADIAAKRRVLAEYQRVLGGEWSGDPHEEGQWIALSNVVEFIASAYADRPGYRQEWAPE